MKKFLLALIVFAFALLFFTGNGPPLQMADSSYTLSDLAIFTPATGGNGGPTPLVLTTATLTTMERKKAPSNLKNVYITQKARPDPEASQWANYIMINESKSPWNILVVGNQCGYPLRT